MKEDDSDILRSAISRGVRRIISKAIYDFAIQENLWDVPMDHIDETRMADFIAEALGY